MWAGKLICGFLGLMTGGFFGFFWGIILGHLLDKLLLVAEDRAQSGSFHSGEFGQESIVFEVIFSLLGCMAKSDGRVSEDEIRHVETLMERMRLTPEARKEAIRFFTEGKSADFNPDQAINAFKQSSRLASTVNLMLVEILVQMAMVDGELTPSELSLLERLTKGLGVSKWQLQLIIARYRGGAYDHFSESAYSGRNTLEEAYTTLGVEQHAAMPEIKKAYRRLMSKHHPDKLQGEGVSDKMLELAKERAQAIQNAYDLLKKHHG